ncbi:hypothetical protein [Methylobacterium sp. J-070]|uniref:hypothetical protein n=1 Tax=Methylobacterium sp. J-070 TaxID=2836650 RepID=UPI001FB9E55E|nr:hypothetical protein [Methylobacterium sp. J-070]MCJ2048705.1 hypothetical protein [Methylobacterium sp. J-070]
MSTVSTAPSQPLAPRWSAQDSPGARMSDTISRAVSAGTLSGADATALTGAVASIDSSLSADRAGSSSAGATQARLDPSTLQDRIDGLISDQVSGGSLTDDQATELKALFASHGRSTEASATSRGDGTPSGPPPGAAADASSPSRSGTATTNDLLATFVHQLQSSQSAGAGYGAAGTSTATTSAALLFDFQS